MYSLTETPINQLITQAKTYYTNAQYQEALQSFRAVITRSPEDYEVNWYIGQCYSNLPNIVEFNQRALEAFHRSITINPNYFYGQIGKGITLYKLARNQEALNALTKAISLNSSHPLTYYYRSLAHQKMENFKEALDDMKKSLEIESNPDKIQRKNELENAQSKRLNIALDSIKAINEYTWKGVEFAIKASPTKKLQLTFKLLKSTNNVFLNSAIHIAKELAAGKNISTVISSTIPEIEKSLFKDIVISEAVKQSAIALGKLGSRVFGALLGEILFSNPLNPNEFEDVTISVKNQIYAMDKKQYMSLMKESLKKAQTKPLDAQTRKLVIKQRASNENKPYCFFDDKKSSKHESKAFAHASEGNKRNAGNSNSSADAVIDCERCYQSSTGKLVPDLYCRPQGSDQYLTFFENANAVKAAYPNCKINFIGPDHDLGHPIGNITVEYGNGSNNSNDRDSNGGSVTTGGGGGGNTYSREERSNYDSYYSWGGDRT